MKKSKLSLIGLIQAVGLAVYCSLAAGLVWYLGKSFEEPPGFTGVIFWLFLLTFSVAVCGSIVFGYSVNLAMNKNVKDALLLLVYTLLYCLGIIAAGLIVLFSII